jgi:hypothetical protein
MLCRAASCGTATHDKHVFVPRTCTSPGNRDVFHGWWNLNLRRLGHAFQVLNQANRPKSWPAPSLLRPPVFGAFFRPTCFFFTRLFDILFHHATLHSESDALVILELLRVLVYQSINSLLKEPCRTGHAACATFNAIRPSRFATAVLYAIFMPSSNTLTPTLCELL